MPTPTPTPARFAFRAVLYLGSCVFVALVAPPPLAAAVVLLLTAVYIWDSRIG